MLHQAFMDAFDPATILGAVTYGLVFVLLACSRAAASGPWRATARAISRTLPRCASSPSCCGS